MFIATKFLNVNVLRGPHNNTVMACYFKPANDIIVIHRYLVYGSNSHANYMKLLCGLVVYYIEKGKVWICNIVRDA